MVGTLAAYPQQFQQSRFPQMVSAYRQIIRLARAETLLFQQDSARRYRDLWRRFEDAHSNLDQRDEPATAK